MKVTLIANILYSCMPSNEQKIDKRNKADKKYLRLQRVTRKNF